MAASFQKQRWETGTVGGVILWLFFPGLPVNTHTKRDCRSLPTCRVKTERHLNPKFVHYHDNELQQQGVVVGSWKPLLKYTVTKYTCLCCWTLFNIAHISVRYREENTIQYVRKTYERMFCAKKLLQTVATHCYRLTPWKEMFNAKKFLWCLEFKSSLAALISQFISSIYHATKNCDIHWHTTPVAMTATEQRANINAISAGCDKRGAVCNDCHEQSRQQIYKMLLLLKIKQCRSKGTDAQL